MYNISARWTVKTDKFTLFVHCNFLGLLSTPVCSRQNIYKQIVNIADENLIDYSFLSRYHITKSKNYFKRRYRIRQRFPMFIGTPCLYTPKRGCIHTLKGTYIHLEGAVYTPWRDYTLKGLYIHLEGAVYTPWRGCIYTLKELYIHFEGAVYTPLRGCIYT